MELRILSFTEYVNLLNLGICAKNGVAGAEVAFAVSSLFMLLFFLFFYRELIVRLCKRPKKN